MSTASTTPPRRSAAGISRPLSGPTSMRSCSAVRSATARRASRSDGADAGVDDGEVHARGHVRQRVAQHERAGAHVVAGDRVGDVDHARARAAPRDHAVADADELVAVAVVGQEA